MPDLVVWLVPVAVLAAGATDPRRGLVAFAACLPLFGSPPGGPYLAALDVAALAAIATAWRAGPAAPSRLAAPAAAFVAVSLASLAPAAWVPPAWSPRVLGALLSELPGVERWTTLFTWRAAADLLLGWALFVAARRAWAGRSPRPLGAALGWGLLAVLAIGHLEFAGLVDLWAWRPIGLPLFDPRFHALFFHSGWLGLFLVLAVPFAAAALAAGGRAERLAAGLLVTLSVAALLFSQQRGAWFSALGQLAVLALVSGRRWIGDRRLMRRAAVGVAAAALLAAALAAARPDAARSLGRRLEDAVADLSNRGGVWLTTLDLAVERPLLGWGIGSFSPLYDGALSPRVEHTSDWLTAHNHLLMVLAERGVLGAAALLLVVGLAAAALWRRAHGSSASERRLAAALLASLAGGTLYGGVQYLFFLRHGEWLCWLLLAAIALTTDGGAGSGTGRGAGRRAKLAAWILAAVALAAVPLRLAIAEPPPRRGDRSFGFRAPERHARVGTFQWTGARAARRLPRKGEILVLRLANGHPKGAQRPVEVTVRVDGEVVFDGGLDGGWRELRVDVGAAEGDPVLVEVRARPTFRPFHDYLRYPELGRSREIRELGVAFAKPAWEPRQAPPPDQGGGATPGSTTSTSAASSGAPAKDSNQVYPSTSRSTVSR